MTEDIGRHSQKIFVVAKIIAFSKVFAKIVLRENARGS
jgi:hypothetical protein